jgi:CHAT domain-containing protein
MNKTVASSSNVALLDYYTTRDEVIIFLIKRNFKEPLVFRTRVNKNGYNTAQYLNLCAQRLLIDFNGLPANWRASPFFSDPDRKRIEASLRLEPEVESEIRKCDPNYPGYYLFRDIYKFKLKYLEGLSEILFPPNLKQSIEKDCDLLCIAPHGALHSIPFHALRWNENEFIVQRFGACHIPSASTLRYCQTKNLARSQRLNYRADKCIVVCSGTKKDYKKFEEDIDILGQHKWSKIIPLRASQSIKADVIGKISNIDLIHFACHGLFFGDKNQDPLESGLLLSSDKGPIESPNVVMEDSSEERQKYFLSAREIYNISLNANLITLRACSSGRATVRRGDELIGLTRAFLYAGTPSLLATLWDVHIESSRMLLSEFYRLWLDEKRPLQKWKALQQAQLSFIQRKGEKYSHPYHWAPFILIGDWI